MGSAGAKTAAVLQGSVDAYVHSGGQYEWDSAAPVAVAHAYGAYAARLDGSALLYNRPDPWLPDLLVCRPELSRADPRRPATRDGPATLRQRCRASAAQAPHLGVEHRRPGGVGSSRAGARSSTARGGSTVRCT